jgi:hypothetical protein
LAPARCSRIALVHFTVKICGGVGLQICAFLTFPVGRGEVPHSQPIQTSLKEPWMFIGKATGWVPEQVRDSGNDKNSPFAGNTCSDEILL